MAETLEPARDRSTIFLWMGAILGIDAAWAKDEPSGVALLCK
jgi:hypothetical protein